MTVPPKLAEMLGKDEFDWDNLQHRRAWLEAWLGGAFRKAPEAAGE